MDIEVKSWLHDILYAIREIESFLEDTKLFTEYQIHEKLSIQEIG